MMGWTVKMDKVCELVKLGLEFMIWVRKRLGKFLKFYHVELLATLYDW